MNKRVAKIAILSIIIAFILLSGEIILRVVAHTNEDNNTVIRGKVLKPYKLPLQTYKNSLDVYLNNVNKKPSKSRYVYDKFLGWNLNSNMNDVHNEQGIFGHNKTFTMKPQYNVLRIALFGDSMTRTDWGFFLERNLTDLGYKDGANLSLKIIKLFQQSVKEEGSDFLTIILPMQSDLFHSRLSCVCAQL